MSVKFLSLPFFLVSVSCISLAACQKPIDTPKTEQEEVKKSDGAAVKSNANADTSSGLVGCYTTLKTEPAQIKINLDNNQYSMQMRQFNDPDKPWDTPAAMQPLPKSGIKTYFDVDETAIEQAIIRPDNVFAVAKIQDSLMNLDERFDSNYLGYIARSETAKGNAATIYKVKCESKL